MLHVTEDSDIDIYLYGLSAADTNLKVKHIHAIRNRNMSQCQYAQDGDQNGEDHRLAA